MRACFKPFVKTKAKIVSTGTTINSEGPTNKDWWPNQLDLGVLRQHLQSEFRDAVQVLPISLEELRGAQEVFVTNSVYGARAVGELIGQDWRVQYSQGPWFAQVRLLLRAQLELLALNGSLKSGSVESGSGQNSSGLNSSGTPEHV